MIYKLVGMITRRSETRLALLMLLATIAVADLTSSALASDFDLFVSFAGRGTIEEHIIGRGFRQLPIIYQQNIDIDHDGKLDLKQYIDHVEGKYQSYAGPITIDWEGNAYLCLTGDPAADMNMNTKDVVDEFVRSIKLLQCLSKERLEIGFYGFPSKLSTRTNSTMEEANNLQKIYNEGQILYPSLYLNRNHLTTKGSIEFAREHLGNALKIACEGKKRKKVYAFITHRWHQKSRFSPHALIPADVFEDYIEAIREVRYENCRVDGIVWWGADEHWLKKRKKEIVASLVPYSNIPEYNKKVIDKYADIILKNFE